MRLDITTALVEEHRLILRMISLLEKNARLAAVGAYNNWQFFLDGVDFIRNYADRFHHAKEEDVLFEALVKNGMPRENSPVAAMLMEHDLGRKYVAAMEAAALAARDGQKAEAAVIAENALAYVELLRDHIAKEDQILYPLAERVIPDEARDRIVGSYKAAEKKTAEDFTARYIVLVEQYERERE